VVPLLVREPDTERRAQQLREDSDIVTWWATRVECASALNRLVRSGELPGARLGEVLRKLDVLSDGWLEIAPADAVRTRALRLLRVHPLRAADALQLSACLTFGNDNPARVTFLSGDARLCEAADKEGLNVLI
jgi:predicted nucleic acid-binding protein